jgi:hypothetical protein
MAGKFSGLNIRGVPQPNPASEQLQQDLSSLGVPLPTPEALPPQEEVPGMDYARANAQAELPQNMYSESSANAQPDQQTQEQFDAARMDNFKLFPEEAPPEILSGSGRERTIEEVRQLEAEQRRREAADARLMSVDLQDAQAVKDSYTKAGQANHIGLIQDTSMLAVDAMTRMPTATAAGQSKLPVSMSGMSQLKVGLNADAKKVANVSTAAVAMVLPILKGAANLDDNQVVDTPEAGSVASMLESDGFEVKAVNGGMNYEHTADMLGSMSIKFANDSRVDAMGRPVDPRSAPKASINPRVAGNIILKSFIESGVLLSGTTPEGVKYVTINPLKGMEFYKATQGVAAGITDASKGKSMLTPGSAEGGYKGGRRNIREGDRKKVNYEALEAAKEAKRVASSIGVITSPVKAFFAGLIGYASLRKQPDAQKLVGVKKDDTPEVINQKQAGWAKRMEYMSGHLQDNQPRYSAYWTDYGSQRIYNDTGDANAQANKDYRAVATAIPKPPIMVAKTKMHTEGVSRSQGAAMLRNIARKAKNKDFTMTAEEQEFAFLATWAHAFDLGKLKGNGKTDSMTIEHLASLVSYEVLAQAAAVGAQLQSLVPFGPDGKVDRNGVIRSLLNPQTFNPDTLTAAQATALSTLVSGSDKETWGYKLQAYLDANEYLNAKKNNLPFTPKVTTAIDMNSAGRAFLGADIGNGEVLKRVGLLMQQQWDAAQVEQTGNTQPYGSPRDYFMQIALDSGVDGAFSDDMKDVSDVVKQYLTEFSDPAKNSRAASFSKDFGKKVLMTTDYGKPANYHTDNALLFLRDHPEFAEKLLPMFGGNITKVAEAINEVYTSSLKKATNIWQQKLPKDIVRFTQMMGEPLLPKGFYGELLSLGGFKYEDTGDYTEVDGERIPHTRRVFDLNAAADDKRTKEEMLEREAPGPGTRARNQIGPILGQYRESVLVMETLNYINGGKQPKDMLFALPVFDNFVLDSNSFLQFRHVANNIILPKVIAWDIQTSMKDAMDSAAVKFNKGLADVDGTVDIGDVDGKYYGVLYNLDTEYKHLADSDPDQLTASMRQLYDILHSPASGYVPPSADRPSNIFVSKDQLRALVLAFGRAKLYRKYSANSNTESLIDKWVRQGLNDKRNMMKQLDSVFEKGMANFMT